MKEFVEKYRPVRQIVRGKTTTEKAGSTDEWAPEHVKQLTSVDDSLINERPPQVDKYESDLEDGEEPRHSTSNGYHFQIRGRPVRARFRLDLKGTLVDIVNGQMINLKVGINLNSFL